MVAIINSAAELSESVRYNENKVEISVAHCIAASGFPKDVEDLTLSNKLKFFTQQAALRPSMKKPAVHISLNLDPHEQLPKQRLVELAEDYMQGIGFGEQPFLVYEHRDSGHQHVHIVSLKVRADGMAIDTNFIGLRKSEGTRKLLEEKYGLVIAEHAGKHEHTLRPVNIEEAVYGKTGTRSAITKVLNGTLKSYNYTSLEELNALLSLYNVRAERGTENSRVFKRGGLLYHIIDKQGKKHGKPIKASRFYSQPTLKYLQERFAENKTHRLKTARSLRNVIGLEVQDQSIRSLDQFMLRLKTKGIDVVLRHGSGGRIYGITYVDHKGKSVFNGRQLHEDFAAAAILRKYGSPHFKQQNNPPSDNALRSQSSPAAFHRWPEVPRIFSPPDQSIIEAIQTGWVQLISIGDPEYNADYLPAHLRIGKKKNRGRNRRTNI